jgi:hypothetical protein
VSEGGVEGLGWLEERIPELSERQAANARMVLEEIERARRDARERGWNFVVRDAPELLEKLRGTNTPSFGSVAFPGGVLSSRSPGSFDFSVSFFNPDPTAYIWTYVYVFVGPALLSADVGQALSLRDTRFPTVTMPDYPGVDLQPNSVEYLNVSLPVPKNLEPTNYLVNCFLFFCRIWGVSDYMDRLGFPLTVI